GSSSLLSHAEVCTPRSSTRLQVERKSNDCPIYRVSWRYLWLRTCWSYGLRRLQIPSFDGLQNPQQRFNSARRLKYKCWSRALSVRPRARSGRTKVERLGLDKPLPCPRTPCFEAGNPSSRRCAGRQPGGGK